MYKWNANITEPQRFLRRKRIGTFSEYKNAFYSGAVLFRSDLKARYRHSFIGWVWVAVPLVLVGFIFLFLRFSGVAGPGESGMTYAAYAFTGLTVWQIFYLSVKIPADAFIQYKKLLLNTRFTVYTLTLFSFLKILFESAIRLIVLLVILLVSGELTLFGVFPGSFSLVCIMAFGLMIGIATAGASALFVDLKLVMESALTVWFFFTPIFYSIPESGKLSALLNLNPMTHLICFCRKMIVLGKTDCLMSSLSTSVIAVCLIPVWISFLKRLKPHII
ncbi:MAG: ABC transporter permease, partial [Candidatus Omnitrophica bacterium]|nr:ABC transporter permease [Candidatus Omnitrophota bacterium]